MSEFLEAEQRISRFVEAWESMEQRGDTIYALHNDGEVAELLLTDLQTLLYG